MNLPPPPSPTLINEAATAMAIRDGFVEKDWYVTQAIKIISSIEYKDFKIIFSGALLSRKHMDFSRGFLKILISG